MENSNTNNPDCGDDIRNRINRRRSKRKRNRKRCKHYAEEVEVKIMTLANGEGLPKPRYETDGAVCCDLSAAINEDIIIEPGRWATIPTGFCFEVPPGIGTFIFPRSGTAKNFGIKVLNSPGVVDWDYRGEIMVLLENVSEEPYTVQRGFRMAQMVFVRTLRVVFVGADTLSETQRDDQGFGSTGLGS